MNIALLSSIANQLMTSDKVKLLGERLPIRRLKSVSFSIEGREQNAEKPSHLGRSGRGAVRGSSSRSLWTEYGAMPKRKPSGTN